MVDLSSIHVSEAMFFCFFVVVFFGGFFLVGGIWGEGLGFSYFFLVKIFPVFILLLNVLRGSLNFKTSLIISFFFLLRAVLKNCWGGGGEG